MHVIYINIIYTKKKLNFIYNIFMQIMIYLQLFTIRLF